MAIQKRTDAPRQAFLLPTEAPTAIECSVEVAVNTRSHRLYTYSVPAALQPRLRPGVVVRCPHGRGDRLIDGVCVSVSAQAWSQSRKPLTDVNADAPPLTAPLVELGVWLSDYYAYPPGPTLFSMIAAPALAAAKRAAERAKRPKRSKSSAVPANDPSAPRRPHDSADEYTLTAGQQHAVQALSAALDSEKRFGVHLLFGVPGSGKTEVYVRVIRAAVAQGRQAILLVPEIALATQLVTRLARRFERVAVLHSRMTPGQRGAALRAIASGEADVVIGTRSAVFAPCVRLGLIVVDEEQESSFKNLAAPYYHARDVAIKRGQIEGVPVVLGSATPALETWHNVHSLPHYHLLRLPERAPGAQLPVTQVAASSANHNDGARLLSRALIREIEQTLSLGRQSILLHNRRGYAAVLRCKVCRQSVPCESCGGRMVLHRARGPEVEALRCHRCGSRGPAISRCIDTSCGGPLEQVGLAIQRLEEELAEAFPTARLLRLDRDTMRKRGDYADALRRFEAHEADILIGTQMIAKGLDFPLVRLVGVVDADAALWLPDFRASERVFQLLVQVVGRAGRREGESLAIVQCSDALVPPIRHALRLDYEAFAVDELVIRQRGFLPPFARLIRCVCSDAKPGRAREAAALLCGGLRRVAGRIHSQIRVDDAEACIIARLRGMHRQQVVVRVPRSVDPTRLLREAQAENLLRPRVTRFSVDVDAIDVF